MTSSRLYDIETAFGRCAIGIGIGEIEGCDDRQVDSTVLRVDSKTVKSTVFLTCFNHSETIGRCMCSLAV